MANESFIQASEVVDQLTASFYEHLNAVKQNVAAVNQLSSAYAKTPSDYLKTIKQITDAQAKQAKTERELANASIAAQRVRQSEITTMIKENALLRDQIRTQQAQEKQVRATGGSYQQLSRELNSTRAAAKNLAADMYLLEQAGEKGSATYNQLQAEFAETQTKVLQLDSTLKGVDSSLGQNQRHVGDYRRAFDGLGNSINQLTRELPAFAVNANTGFLAISNNLPMLFDEIRRIRLENEALRASGEATVPAVQQLARSFFSWNTALSLGVTLLTLYGGKLYAWITSAKAATRETDQLTAATDRYNQTLVESQTNSEVELTYLRYKLAVSKDLSKSEAERAAAAQELIDKYPGYLKGLSKEALMLQDGKQNTQEYNKAMTKLTADIQKRIEAESKQKASRESLKIAAELEQEAKLRQDLNDQARDYYEKYGGSSKAAKSYVDGLRQQVKARQELLKEDQEFISKFGNLGVATSGSVDMLGLYTPAQITDLQKRAELLRHEVEKQQKEIAKTFQETSLLDFNPKDKDGDLQIEALVDFEASAYALQKARLENQLAFNKEIVENEKNGYADREVAAVRYGEILLELNQNLRDEELRLLNKGTTDQIAELKRRAAEGEITQKNAAAVIESIEKQAAYDRELIYENYSKGVIDANAEIGSSLEGVWGALNEQEQLMRKLDFMTNNQRQLGNIFENVDANTTIEQYDKIKKHIEQINDSEKQNQIDNLRLQRQSIDAEIQKISEQQKTKENNQAINDLLTKQKEIDNEIVGIETERKRNAAALTEEMKRATDTYLKSIQSSVLSGMGFGSLSSIVSGEFDKALDNAQTFQEKFAVIFNTVGNIAKDAFAFMTQNSQAAFDAEYVMLERRRDIAIKFAGENRAAQDEINRQYDERQREIKLRELKAQKEQAIFNAVINTAQGVTSALATANIPLSILIGALGAAQIAFIASQQIPAYADGGVTDTSGNILVNDAKGVNYKEVVVTPGGKTIKPNGRNRVMNVPKGTRIFKNYAEHEAALNGMLANAGIAPASGMLNRIRGVEPANGLTKSDLMDVMRQTIGSMTSNPVNVSIDHNGINTTIEHGHSQMQLRNNHLELKGRTFGKG